MQLLLDSADEAQIAYWWAQGVLDGVTTNPSVMRRDGVSDPQNSAIKIASLIAPGVVHVEVTSHSGSALVAEAAALHRIGDNVVVKVPVITPEGRPLLREISELTAAGVPVNCTACLSLPQVMLAAKAGAKYISVLAGRIEDEGGQSADVLGAARAWLDLWHLPARLIAASIRGPADVGRGMRAGAHSVTVTPDVLARSVDHKYSRHTVQQFLNDAAQE